MTDLPTTDPRGIGVVRWFAAAVLLAATLAAAAPAGAQMPLPDLERQARELFDQEKYREALDALQAILARDAGNRTGNILMAFTMARLEMTEAAIVQTRKALDRFPTHVKLQLLLAGLLSSQEATRNEAINRYQAVLQKDPDNAVAQIGLAEAYRAAGRTFESIEIFSRLTQKTPTDPRLEVRLGQLYGALGDLPEARRHFERAYALDRENVDAVRSLAILSDVEDQPADAARYYRELAALFPGDSSALIAVRSSQDRLSEPAFPISIAEMQKKPLEDYLKAAGENSKQLQHRVAQLEATRARSWARWLPSFFVNPSQGRVNRPAPNIDDNTTNLSFSFGWNLGDLAVDPYRINITGMQADLEAVKISVYNEVTGTYYARLQNIAQYRQLQRALALEPQNTQIRQSKDTIKYNILTLTERLKLYTGMP
jgi:tetratricopeptide (TPR) repeat protein